MQLQSAPAFRRFSRVMGLMFALSSLGCPSQPVAKMPSLPFKGARLRIASSDGPARILLETQGANWSRISGAELAFVSPGADADVIVFNPAEIGRLVGEQRLAAVPKSITDSGSWAGLSRVQRNKLLLWGDTAYALPLIADATILLYRGDLLKKANRPVPNNYTEFVQLADELAKQRGRPSLPALLNDDDWDREFHLLAAALVTTPVMELETKSGALGGSALAAKFAFQFHVDSAAPRLTEPGFAAALTWLRQMAPHRSPKGVVASFQDDEAVFAFATLRDLAALLANKSPHLYGVAPIPVGAHGERVPYVGPAGVSVGVAAMSSSLVAAWDFLNWLMSPAVSIETIHNPAIGSAPFRGAHLNDKPEGWFNYGLDVAGTDRLRDAVAAAVDPRIINAPLRLRVARQEEYRRVLINGLRDAIKTNTAAVDAMKAINAQWIALDGSVPQPERLLNYLRSLNLKP